MEREKVVAKSGEVCRDLHRRSPHIEWVISNLFATQYPLEVVIDRINIKYKSPGRPSLISTMTVLRPNRVPRQLRRWLVPKVDHHQDLATAIQLFLSSYQSLGDIEKFD